MSKNDNPKTRPGTSRRRRPKPQAPAPAPTTPVRQSRVRRFLPTVMIPHAVALLLVIVAAVAALMFTDTSMVNLPATIAQLWLALNMGTVAGSGEVVAVIPMVPAMIFLWALATRIHRAVKERVSIADLGVLAALAFGVPISLTVITWLMLHDASAVLNVGVPPMTSLSRILLLHAVALLLGMGPKLWRALARRYRVPEWLIDAAAQALRFLLTYAAVAAVVVAVMIAVNHEIFTAALGGYGDSGAVFALVLLSVLYLPNVIIWAMGMLVGAPLYFGEASISVFSVHLVPLPPLPVLAAIPTSAPEWAVALLLLPAAVAARVCLKNPMRLRVSLSAAGFSAVFFLILMLFSGGVLGVYGYVGLNRPAAFGLLLGYLLIVVGLIAGIDRLRAGAGPLSRPGLRATEEAQESEETVDAAEEAAATEVAGDTAEGTAEAGDDGDDGDRAAGEDTEGAESPDDPEAPEGAEADPTDVQQLTEAEPQVAGSEEMNDQANDFKPEADPAATAEAGDPDLPAPPAPDAADAAGAAEEEPSSSAGAGTESDDDGSAPHGR